VKWKTTMGVIAQKILRDMLANKFRTLLTVLSSAAGVLALGLTIGLGQVLVEKMQASLGTFQPPVIELQFASPQEDLAKSLASYPEVASAQSTQVNSMRWMKPGETGWKNADLMFRPDYLSQQMNIVRLEEGRWPADHELAMDRITADFFQLKIGDSIQIERSHQMRSVPIVGIVTSYMVFPPPFGGNALFHGTEETAEWLTGSRRYGFIGLRLKQWPGMEAAETEARSLTSRLRASGVPVSSHTLYDPAVHFYRQTMDASFTILGIMGLLSLGLSGFLIVNTTNAIIAQQIWQIGVMKTVGGSTLRIAGVYLLNALCYGILSVMLAVPLAAVITLWMAPPLLNLFDIVTKGFIYSPSAVVLQLGVGLATPVLAALVPVWSGVRTSAAQAISSHGIGLGFGTGRIDRLLVRLQQTSAAFRRIPNMFSMALRNAFRRKARVALSLATLVIAGLMFLSVLSLSLSFNGSIDKLLEDFGWHVWIQTPVPMRADKMLEIARSLPGVEIAEVWHIAGVSLSLPHGGVLNSLLWGIPEDSQLFHPNIVAGRWLLPEDGRAVLINQKVAREKDIHVGDTVTFRINEQDSHWTVVGLIVCLDDNQADSYASFSAVTRAMGITGRGTQLLYTLRDTTAEAQAASARDALAAFDKMKIKGTSSTLEEARTENRASFNILIELLLMVSILAAVVGSLGLMGSMSINVAERGKEIGVMRSIGGTTGAIAGIFVSEGLMIGVSSWLISAPLAFPVGYLFTQILGGMLFPMTYQFSFAGLGFWFLIVTVMAALASLWPAWQATRISVRESLAYE
jgi:putative ABC transport system permease protein